ncbi:protein kinase [Streptomyces sp. NPDC001046]|uniref:serine/threonine-protein kinase n=1 Tax=Streptomyces sp. NPDC001046 TaxID=3364543 RepID=UPI0036CF6859
MSNDGGGADDARGRLVGGRYRLIERIGSGATGTVWRAHDELARREVAVRQPRLPGDPDDVDHRRAAHRLHREARAAARVDHPAAVTIHEVVVEPEPRDEPPGPKGPDELDATEMLDGLPWIVMESVRGEPLHERLRRGPLAPGEAARIGLAVLGALHAAHSVGIVHRDVKPANVLLGPDGRVVLTDFGIGQPHPGEHAAGGGESGAAPEFVAPERMSGRGAGPASDLWSLGALLHTAVEGSSPFRRDTPEATRAAVLESRPPAPERAGPLGPLISRLLRTDPDERPDAEEAAEHLAAVAGPPAAAEAAEHLAAIAGPSAAEQPTPTGAPAAESPTDPTPAQAPAGDAAVEAPTAVPAAHSPGPPRRAGLLRPAPLALLGALLAGGIGTATQLTGTSSAETGNTGTTSAETSHTGTGAETRNTGTGNGNGRASADASADVGAGGGQADGPDARTAPAADWIPHRERGLAAVLRLPGHYRALDRTGSTADQPRTVLYGDERGGGVRVRLQRWDRAPGSPLDEARKGEVAIGGRVHTEYRPTRVQGHDAVLADTAYTRDGTPRRLLRLLVRTGGDRLYELRVDMARGTPEEREGTGVFEGARDGLEFAQD